MNHSCSRNVARLHADLFQVIPQCEDDLLLHVPYEDHYNDVTCHHAVATQYGDGVSLQFDPGRNGNVACFTGGIHFEVNIHVIYIIMSTMAQMVHSAQHVVNALIV